MSCCGGAPPAGVTQEAAAPSTPAPPSALPSPPKPPSPREDPPPTEDMSSSSPPAQEEAPQTPSSPSPPSKLVKNENGVGDRAIPLTLSSMARLDADSDTPGAVLGLCAIVHHALLACAKNTPRLLTNGSGDWKARKLSTLDITPQVLSNTLGFDMAYVRRCLLYDGAAVETLEDDADETWQKNPAVLGCISLHYASQDLMEEEELVVTEDPDMDGDLPATVMYKATVEYKTRRPSSGFERARQAEELSMLTFGASVDDDVKLGALSSIYDRVGKYRLEITSVRKKTYTFDVVDTVLSDGTVPMLDVANMRSSNMENGSVAEKEEDPFVKSVAVTVKDNTEEEFGAAMTKLSLKLEGNLRQNALEDLEVFHSIPRKLRSVFPSIGEPQSLVAAQCKQALLLDKKQAGRVYINGRFVTEWGNDIRMATNAPALFGMDISHSVPVWHGRVVDYAQLKHEYATLWQELLIDAKHADLNLASKLLSRMINGRDPDDLDEDADGGGENSTEGDCLESDVMSSTKYDSVGICAKALATRFALEYGKSAFPCLEHEVDWVRTRLGRNTPVVVPERALRVLRRGGFFDVQKTTQEVWFSASPASVTEREKVILGDAIEMLKKVGCDDVTHSRVVFVDMEDSTGAIQCKLLCRYDSTMKQYHVNRHVMQMKDPALSLGLYLALEHPDGYVLNKFLLESCTR